MNGCQLSTINCPLLYLQFTHLLTQFIHLQLVFRFVVKDICIILLYLKTKDMRRYNLFRIHKGLRALLYDTALQLQKTAFSDFEQSDAALENIYLAIEFIEAHVNLEEAYIFSPLAKYEKATIAAFNRQQQESLDLAGEIKKVSRILQLADSGSERRIAGSALSNAYMQIMVSQLHLMSQEEIEINHLLWYHFND